MKKLFLFQFSVAFFLLNFCLLIAVASAQTFPDPKPSSFLTNGYKYNRTWPAPDITIALEVSGNLGYVSSNKLSKSTSSGGAFPTNTINPRVFNFQQPFSLKWNINDMRLPGYPDIDNCQITVNSLDTGKSLKSFDGGAKSGTISFDPLYLTPVSSLSPGNYSFDLSCNLDNGAKLSDLVYVYLMPNSVSPKPIAKSFSISATESDMRKYWAVFKVEDNPGATGALGEQQTPRMSAVNTGVLNPLAFTQSQFNSAILSLDVFRLPNVFKYRIESCTVPGIGTILGSEMADFHEAVGSTPAFGYPYSIFKKTWSTSLSPGNHELWVDCALSNIDKYHIKDLIYVYILPGPPGPEPAETLKVDLTAIPASITAGQNVTLTADVSGTAKGTIHYQFDCTNNGSYELDVVNNIDPYSTDKCKSVYSSPGIYTAKVHVERGSAPPATDTVKITVTAPKPVELTFFASPSSIIKGSSSTLIWSVKDAAKCTASGGWSGDKSPLGGSQSVSPSSTVIYTLTCTGLGGSDWKDATVTVTAPVPGKTPPSVDIKAE